MLSLVLAASMLLALSAIPAYASQPTQSEAQLLQISIDKSSAVTKNGDKVEFSTTVTNTSGEASPNLIVAMNIINLDSSGDVVDPEDWSPERTQYVEALAPGASHNQSWTLNTILEGNYMVYVVLIPTPDGENQTTHPVTSQGIHVTVNSFTRVNPGGILPFAIGIPVVLVLVLAGVLWLRRRGIDNGNSE